MQAQPRREPANLTRSRVWSAAAIAMLAVVLATIALSSLLRLLNRTMGLALLDAAGLVLLACAVGLSGSWVALRGFPQEGASGLAALGLRGWVFAPATLLLLKQNSLWAFCAAAVAAAFTASQLGEHGSLARQDNSSASARPVFTPMFTVLPVPSKRPLWIAAVISTCLVLTLALGVGSHTILACAVLSVAASLFAYQWASGQRNAIENPQVPKQGFVRLLFTAVLVTLFALSPSIRTELSTSGLRAAQGISDFAHRRLVLKKPDRPELAGAGFHGVILWPLPDHSKVVPPVPHPALASASRARPLVIPFRGPYLYFKPRMASPGSQAHVARGSPLHVSVRASGGDLLRMDAQQDLAAPILLSCCRAIEVSLDDQEPGRPGVIVGLLLTDTTAPENPAQDLGLRRIEAGSLSSSQVLRFLLPRPARITRFTRLTVLLFPSAQHESEGRRVAVEQFALIPR